MFSFRQQPFRQLVKDIPGRHPVFALQRTFPDNTTSPSCTPERRLRPRVDGAVARDLRLPELLTGLGPFEKMAVVAVPETSVGKQNGVASGKNHIRLSWQCTVMQPETKACTMQTAAQEQLRLRIRAPDTSHHSAADFRGYNMNHLQ